MKIADLDLSKRARRALLFSDNGKQKKIRTIKQLIKCTATDLIERKGIGRTSLREIEMKLQRNNLGLRQYSIGERR